MIDASELFIIGEVAREAAAHAVERVGQEVSRGALRVRTQLRKEARESSSFKQIAPTISYRTTVRASDAEAEIGPNKTFGGAASLAGIAYFGSSRPGGGTLPDPVKALEAEEPRLEKALGDVLVEIFG